METHLNTIDVAPRDHFKSTRLYADVMYRIFISTHSWEAIYVSYTAGMSSYHLKKIKEMVKNNPFFCYIHDLNPHARGKMEYSWDGRIVVKIDPQGMLTFKRGVHVDCLLVDDPYADENDKLRASQVLKVNDIFKGQLIPMIKKGGYCRVVGTPQTRKDIFFDDNLGMDFKMTITDAILNEAEQKVLWPEWMSWGKLQRRRRVLGNNLFNQEYRCRPAHEIDAFLEEAILNACVDKNLKESEPEDGTTVYAGYDPAEKVHAAHATIWQVKKGKVEEWTQLVSKFWDKTRYRDQLRWWRLACDKYRIKKVKVDNTAPVFSAMEQEGLLPRQFELINQNNRFNFEIAHGMDALMTESVAKTPRRTIRCLSSGRKRMVRLGVLATLSVIRASIP